MQINSYKPLGSGVFDFGKATKSVGTSFTGVLDESRKMI
jgi:hypothetical protein